MQQQNRYLFGTVFLTGAAVLVIEIAAVRLLAPYYGSSLTVFSSVLTVILAALSVGYWYGGKRADQKHSIDELYVIITISGLLVLALYTLAILIVPELSDSFSVVTGPLVFSLGLFFLPAFLLGMISPYIIKLQSLITPSSEIGSVVGKTFFWGTVGSISGSLASGFWLIPTLGVELTIILVSGVLIALGAVVPLFLNLAVRRWWLLLVTTIGLVFGLFVWQLDAAFDEQYLYRDDGLYSSIRISDVQIYDRPARLLNRDTNNSSAIFLDGPELVFRYAKFALLYQTLKPDSERVLVLGGGAYTIPKRLAELDPDLTIDVVEIEPRLYELSQEYFGLTETSQINNYPMDARVFLRQSTERYDMIFGDTFGTDHAAPFHLTTYEYFTLMQERLTPGGLLIQNYIGRPKGPRPSLTGSTVKTILAVFPNTRAFMLNPDDKTDRQNIMFVSRNDDTPLDLSAGTPLPSGETLALDTLELELDSYDLSREYLLTDDHAPVEYLMAKQQ